MQLIDVKPLEYPRHDQLIYLHNFTDIHLGAEGCDERQLDRDIHELHAARMRGEQHFWFIGGDAINGIGPKDKRHDSTAVAPRFKRYSGKSLFLRQVRAVAEKFKLIQPWGLFVGAGNHEEAVAKNSEYDPAEDLAERLDLPYAGYSAAFRIRLQPQNTTAVATVLAYWHHGWGAGRTKGAKANLGMRLLDIINVDLYFTGHVHEPIMMPEEELTLNRSGDLRLVARDRLVIVGSSYLKTYPAIQSPQDTGCYDPEREVQSDYGERKGYRPSVIGHTGASIELTRVGADSHVRVRLRPVDFR